MEMKTTMVKSTKQEYKLFSVANHAQNWLCCFFLKNNNEFHKQKESTKFAKENVFRVITLDDL